MKRTFFVLALAFALALAIGAGVGFLPAEAAGMSDLSDMEGLVEDLPEGFFDEDVTKSGAAVEKASSPAFLRSFVLSLLVPGLTEALSFFAKLIGLLTLAAALRLLGGESAGRATGLCVGAGIIWLVLTAEGGDLSGTLGYFDNLTLLVDLLLPLTGALYAMGGNVKAAVVNSGGFSILLWLTENLCAGSVKSFSGIGTALSVCGTLAPGSGFEGILRFMKKTYTLLLSAVAVLLCFSLSVQTSLSAAADSVAMRGAKLLAGSAIPVVGGSVGDTVKTLSSSLSFLKNTVGLGGVLLLVFLILPPLCSLVLHRMVLSAAGTCADVLGLPEEKKLLEGFAELYGFLIAALSVCSVATVFFLTVFVKCEIAM